MIHDLSPGAARAAPVIDPLATTRVRHALKFRLGRVTRVKMVTPELIRITLSGDDLHDFLSASFDDHVKVFFQADPDVKPIVPTVGPDGPVRDAARPPPVMRDFTPRRIDNAGGELDLEFYLHEAGPATSWASQAKPGQYLLLGGPRGSMIIPAAFDWHLLIGDDTALPAIARRLEELPHTSRAIVVAEVAAGYARLDLKSRASLEVVWVHRAGADASDLMTALAALPPLPAGEGFAWAATESALARQIRTHLVGERGMDKSRVRCAAYWKRGEQSVHEVIGD